MANKGKTTELKVKQDCFIKLIGRGASPKQAAEKMGIAVCTASRWMKDPYVAQKIEHVNKKAMYNVGYEKADWLRDTLEVLDRNMGRKPYQPVKEGEEPVYKFVSHEARKTLEILGKHLGIYAERVDLQASGQIEICWKSADPSALPDTDIIDMEPNIVKQITGVEDTCHVQ